MNVESEISCLPATRRSGEVYFAEF